MILSKAVVSFQYRQRLLSLFILTLRNFSIIMKKLFIYSLLATILMSPQGIKAKDIVVELKNGSHFVYTIAEDDLIIRFIDGQMWLQEDAFAFTDIKKFYTQESVGIKELQLPPLRVSLTDNQTLHVSKPEKDSSVGIFTTDGKACLVPVSVEEEYMDLNISSLIPGIYILKVGNQSIKWKKP